MEEIEDRAGRKLGVGEHFADVYIGFEHPNDVRDGDEEVAAVPHWEGNRLHRLVVLAVVDTHRDELVGILAVPRTDNALRENGAAVPPFLRVEDEVGAVDHQVNGPVEHPVRVGFFEKGVEDVLEALHVLRRGVRIEAIEEALDADVAFLVVLVRFNQLVLLFLFRPLSVGDNVATTRFLRARLAEDVLEDAPRMPRPRLVTPILQVFIQVGREHLVRALDLVRRDELRRAKVVVRFPLQGVVAVLNAESVSHADGGVRYVFEPVLTDALCAEPSNRLSTWRRDGAVGVGLEAERFELILVAGEEAVEGEIGADIWVEAACLVGASERSDAGASGGVACDIDGREVNRVLQDGLEDSVIKLVLERGSTRDWTIFGPIALPRRLPVLGHLVGFGRPGR